MAKARPFEGGAGRGGEGIPLGPAQNQFGNATTDSTDANYTADKAAAEALRDAYAAANAAWLALYNGDRSFILRLVWTGNAQAYQRRNTGGTAWEDVTRVVPGARGPGPTDAQITAQIKPYAVIGGPLAGDADIAAVIARDTEVAAAVANLRAGVAAAYDTLDELADALVQTVSVRNGMIVLTRMDGSEVTGDATALARTDTQINALIQAALQAAVVGNTETGISVTYNADGTLDFVVTGGGGGGVTLAQALAAVLAGTGIAIDRSTPNEITISSTTQGGGGTPPVVAHSRYVTVTPTDVVAAADFTGDHGASSDDDDLILPTFTENSYLTFAYLESRAAPTFIGVKNGQNQIGGFLQLAAAYNVTIGETEYVLWQHVDGNGESEVVYPVLSGTEWRIA